MRFVGQMLLSAIVLASMTGVSRAEVTGQAFDILVDSSYSGPFEAELFFDTASTFQLFVPADDGGDGTYTQSGAAITVIRGEGTNGDDYFGSFVAVSYDPKQLPGVLGAIARRNNTPATISGRGVGNYDDTFTFEGEEVFLPQ